MEKREKLSQNQSLDTSLNCSSDFNRSLTYACFLTLADIGPIVNHETYDYIHHGPVVQSLQLFLKNNVFCCGGWQTQSIKMISVF